MLLAINHYLTIFNPDNKTATNVKLGTKILDR